MRSNKGQFIRFMISTIFCSMLPAVAVSAASTEPNIQIQIPWDWSGVIGTGQSLAVGEQGRPILSRTQPHHNLKLSSDHLPWPIDPNDTNLTMVPLVEPIGRFSTNYPSSWPDNIAGETPHSAMANQISALVRAASGRDFVGVHTEVGENGQCMIYLKKNAERVGVNGRSYEAAMIETKAIARLARAAGKTYGVGAITVTHGECDAGNQAYENDLYQLWSDYNNDIRAITEQKQKVQMILSQQNSCNDYSASTLAQWKVGVDHPGDIVCSGPKYQYPSAEGVHLTANGYRQLGEKYGQIYYERVVLGKNWRPLEPTSLERTGAVITVHFHVPVPPLMWDTHYAAPHQSITEWKNGKGFEVRSARGEKVAISSAAIAGDTVVITCASGPGPGARVGYAMTGEKTRMAVPFEGTYRWGLLRDSDPFVGAVTGLAQPNYSVAFELPAP